MTKGLFSLDQRRLHTDINERTGWQVTVGTSDSRTAPNGLVFIIGSNPAVPARGDDGVAFPRAQARPADGPYWPPAKGPNPIFAAGSRNLQFPSPIGTTENRPNNCFRPMPFPICKSRTNVSLK